MIRFTFRQFRTQAAVALGALITVAIVAVITGIHLVHLYDTTVGDCAKYNDCSAAGSSFLLNDLPFLGVLANALVVVVPGLIGIFWGAPLVARELEVGTFRLAWTQSVTRTNWLAVKLAVVGLASMVVAGLLSLMITWWSSPIDRVTLNVFSNFDQRDIVPIGYAAFAFALGTTAGVLIRRTVPAMAATLVAFATTQLLVYHFALPWIITPLQRSYPLVLGSTVSGYGQMNQSQPNLFPGTPNISNAWIFSTNIVDKAGHALTSGYLQRACPLLGSNLGGSGAPGARSAGGGAIGVGPAPAGATTLLKDCVVKVGATYHELVTYQPPGHYWPLQWIVLGIYLAAALALAGLSYWWIRRRRA
jgi:ABC-type transport system involved in multi-copper enzyme maturation permease subunit